MLKSLLLLLLVKSQLKAIDVLIRMKVNNAEKVHDSQKEYQRGVADGMEFLLAFIENREPRLFFNRGDLGARKDNTIFLIRAS